MLKHYAVYKGDKFLYEGTARECSKYFEVEQNTVYFWCTPANRKRAKNTGKFAIVVEEEEEDERE